jgi:transposase
MSEKQKAQYASEFKESAVKLALGSNKSIAQTARELGVKVNTLHTWIDKSALPKEKDMKPEEHIYQEVKRLKKELAQVTIERDILKKATAYFAKESR